jgi:hypothetical protein
MATKNLYKVPQAQWRKWRDAEKQLFNDVYSDMMENKNQFFHPKQKPPIDEYWGTTAWNAAWIAADYLKDQRRGLA